MPAIPHSQIPDNPLPVIQDPRQIISIIRCCRFIHGNLINGSMICWFDESYNYSHHTWIHVLSIEAAAHYQIDYLDHRISL